ncbi:MAG: diguanylate cyclase [Gammaproteobacteria bacterium]|nr:diguanylate cyclase [Gammaproteobacteria bacterium]
MSLTYCERYHFDRSRIEARLQGLQLGEADHALARRLQQEVIRPQVGEIVDQFYAWLVTLEEARRILVDDELIARLRGTQRRYLLSLGVDFDQPDYFETRLRVGQAHVWVGLSLSLYQCAYRYMGQLILDRIDLQREDAPALLRFVHKIIALDMALAIETYHQAQVESLEEALEHARRQHLRLRIQASTDALTGVANHEAILAELEEGLRESAVQSSPPSPPHSSMPRLVVAMVDIDFFKQVNDSHGHLVGDKVLIEVTRRMRAALRDVDSIGRYGGEEFLVLINASSMAVARRVAERIRSHVAAQPINLQGLEIPVTLSLGLAEGRPGEAADELVARADQALYAAKTAGRNQVQLAAS